MPSRRAILTGLSALSVLPVPAFAQAKFPDKPIRVIVPFGPGGLADVTIRIVGDKLGALLGQQIVVVNQPGAGGVTAARAVLSSPADGYTLALFTNGTAISVPLVKTMGFDPVAEFVPVSGLGEFDFVFVTAGTAPFKSLQDFIAAAKAKPGTLNIGTINIGSSQNLSAALFKALAGVDCQIVPFRTTPDVLTATLRQDVHLAIDGYASVKSLLGDGQLRALATSGSKRSESLKDIPAASESGVANFDVTSWNALFAPTGTPADVVALLNAKLREALADADVKKRLADLGISSYAGPSADIGARLKSDITKWGGVIERAGIAKQ
jgi:tripartite-type tricarboxylate transporter receptor subunit TctC